MGSGLVTTLGNQVADILGLREFSIFPTTHLSGEARLPITIGIETIGIETIGIEASRHRYYSISPASLGCCIGRLGDRLVYPALRH